MPASAIDLDAVPVVYRLGLDGCPHLLAEDLERVLADDLWDDLNSPEGR